VSRAFFALSLAWLVGGLAGAAVGFMVGGPLGWAAGLLLAFVAGYHITGAALRVHDRLCGRAG
jgi:hypothetical protein